MKAAIGLVAVSLVCYGEALAQTPQDVGSVRSAAERHYAAGVSFAEQATSQQDTTRFIKIFQSDPQVAEAFETIPVIYRPSEEPRSIVVEGQCGVVGCAWTALVIQVFETSGPNEQGNYIAATVTIPPIRPPKVQLVEFAATGEPTNSLQSDEAVEIFKADARVIAAIADLPEGSESSAEPIAIVIEKSSDFVGRYRRTLVVQVFSTPGANTTTSFVAATIKTQGMRDTLPKVRLIQLAPVTDITRYRWPEKYH